MAQAAEAETKKERATAARSELGAIISEELLQKIAAAAEKGEKIAFTVEKELDKVIGEREKERKKR